MLEDPSGVFRGFGGLRGEERKRKTARRTAGREGGAKEDWQGDIWEGCRGLGRSLNWSTGTASSVWFSYMYENTKCIWDDRLAFTSYTYLVIAELD